MKSIQIKIFFLFNDVGFIGPTKSMAHFSKGSIITEDVKAFHWFD